MSTSRPSINRRYEEDQKSMEFYEDLQNGFGLMYNDMPKIVAAAERGDNEYVKEFCEYHTARGTLSLNQTDSKYHRTALHWASIKNHVAVVNTLLQYGANPNIEDFDTQSTPINHAAERGHLRVVDALLRNEKTDTNDPWLQRNARADANHLCSSQKVLDYRDRMVKSVVGPMFGSKKVAKNEGISPLFIAADHGHKEVVSRLLACEEVDIEAKLLGEQTARDAALSKGHTEIAHLIEVAEKDRQWKRSDEYREIQRQARIAAENRLIRNEAYLTTTKTFLADFKKQNSGLFSIFHRPSPESQQLVTELKVLLDENVDTNTKADKIRTRFASYHADRKWKEDSKKSSRTIALLKQSTLWEDTNDTVKKGVRH